jgi:hypothetical protein
MPQIKLLDRHKVTVEERLKAEKLWEREHGTTGTKKHMSQILSHAGKSTFSKGEKDLYRDVGELRKLDEERKRQLELERSNFYKKRTYVGIPVPTKKQENKDKFGFGNREEVLDEWEKNMIKKVFRAEFDKDKQGIQSKDELKRLMTKLLNDDCIIGKVPAISEAEAFIIADEWTFAAANGRLTWFEFRDALNQRWEWRLQDREKLDETIEQFFKLAYKYRMQGNEKDSKEYAARALRLQGSLTKTKPM